ncbi:MAG: heme A synthase [Acidobacteria bacterium]|nr:heme A synthase [Acidobacteriota bacterium]
MATLVLIVAGGLVTSTGSGLAVPDWPNTYGWFMFSFPLSKMVGGIFYEHGHRLIASTVGLLTIILAAWLWKSDPRRWVRRLGFIGLGAVIAQGLLGGLTVILLLPAPVSIAHAGLAQLFFCITVSLALFTSRGWIEGYSQDTTTTTENTENTEKRKRQKSPVGSVRSVVNRQTDNGVLRKLASATTIIIYAQILLGATMRHTGAGLAIPDFPLAFGRLVPPLDRLAASPVAIHFSHRVGAVVVSLLVMALARRIWKYHRQRPELLRLAQGMLVLLLAQVTLGGLTVLSGKAVALNTAHVVTGAMLLGTSLVIALRARRASFIESARPIDVEAGASAREDAGAAPILQT